MWRRDPSYKQVVSSVCYSSDRPSSLDQLSAQLGAISGSLCMGARFLRFSIEGTEITALGIGGDKEFFSVLGTVKKGEVSDVKNL